MCYNPTRCEDAEWVTIRRIRLTDSFTHVWWLAKSDFPKADNRKVLRPYSDSMKGASCSAEHTITAGDLRSIELVEPGF